MKRSIITITLLSLALFSADQAQAQLYGAVGRGDPRFPGKLLTIDRTTGAATAVGNLGFNSLGGLAYDANTNTLYGTRDRNKLVTIDQTTGAPNLVGNIGVEGVSGLAFDPNTDTLFGATVTRKFIRIDTATGVGTEVGDISFAIVGLAFDSNTNTLYGASFFTDELVVINTSTGQATAVGPFGFPNIDGLGFDADTNTLYGNDGITKELVTIDPATGAASTVGPLGENDVTALAVRPASQRQRITPQTIISDWERTPEPTANTMAGRDRWQANGGILSYTDNAASAVISPHEKTDGFEFRALFKAPNDNDLVGLVFGFQDIDNNYRLSFSGGGVRDYNFRGLALVKEVGGVPTALFNDINIKWMANTYYELIVGRDAAGDLFFEVIQAGLGTIAQGTVADATFTSGKFGIYARSQRADFSNIICSEIADPAKLVFVTSTVHNGDLGGLAGADAICNARAAGAGLAGSFTAWLSDSTTHARDRVSTDGAPYRRTDGVVVADDFADLTGLTLDAPIKVDEFGTEVVDPLGLAWTATNTGGLGGPGSNCNEWNAVSGLRGGTGVFASTFQDWTQFFTGPCNLELRLYCFQD